MHCNLITNSNKSGFRCAYLAVKLYLRIDIKKQSTNRCRHMLQKLRISTTTHSNSYLESKRITISLKSRYRSALPFQSALPWIIINSLVETSTSFCFFAASIGFFRTSAVKLGTPSMVCIDYANPSSVAWRDY